MVPFGILFGILVEGVTLNPKGSPLHKDVFIVFTIGFGFTLTFTVKGTPKQLSAAPDFGVTVYCTVCKKLVLFVKVWLIEFWSWFWLDSPSTLLLSTTVHVKVVPDGRTSLPSNGGIVNDSPLQIVGVLFAKTGFGLTVTFKEKGVPVQLPDFGVIAYVTTLEVEELLISVPVIGESTELPKVCPVIAASTVGDGHV